MMNIFSHSLKEYCTIPIKYCKEIKFSHGGHLFACQNGSNIQVFKFYTAETPQSYLFKGHDSFVRSINWLEDDSGFVSSGYDNVIYFWRFPPPSELPANNSMLTEAQKPHYWPHFTDKNVGFSSVNVHKFDAQPAEIFATGTDKSIRKIVDGKEVLKYQENRSFSTLAISHNRRFFVCGFGSPND